MEAARLEHTLTIAAFLAALFVPAVASFVVDPGAVSETENRALAPPPALEPLDAFPDAFDAWYDDHFALRPVLLPRYHRLRFGVFGISPTDEVIVGSDGFLYLTEGTLEFAPLTGEELSDWERELARRKAYLDERGIAYLIVVVPDKTDVYPEHLPLDLLRRKQAASRIGRFAEEMRRRTEVAVLDLLPPLLAAKDEHELFFRNDPHWNWRGSYVGYGALLEAARALLPELAAELWPVPWESLGIEEREIGGGGLARMMGLTGYLTERSWKPRKDELEGAAVRFELAPPPEPSFGTDRADRPGRLLMFRDSYATALTPYLSETFGHAVYLWQRPTFRSFREWVEREQPDLVIEERVSRFLRAERSDYSPAR